MKSCIPLLVLASFAPLLLGGCGLRGPLYLPEDRPQVAAEVMQPDTSATAGKSDTAPPQAQKRDRTTQSAEQPAPQPTN